MSQLTQVVHQFARALEMKQQVDVIYFNVSKAFDQVPHKKNFCLCSSALVSRVLCQLDLDLIYRVEDVRL